MLAWGQCTVIRLTMIRLDGHGGLGRAAIVGISHDTDSSPSLWPPMIDAA
jgi:hypothetical protein